MRRCPAAASLALLWAGFAVQAQTPVKVAVISIQGAIAGTKDGQKAAQQLDSKFLPKNQDFKNRQAEIVHLQEQLRKDGAAMAEEKRTQLAREIDGKKKRLQRDVQAAETDLRDEQQQALAGLGQRMMAVIEKYAKEHGYSLIVDVSNQNSPVLYASSGIDITEDIVAVYDKTAANGAPVDTTAVPKAPGTAR